MLGLWKLKLGRQACEARDFCTKNCRPASLDKGNQPLEGFLKDWFIIFKDHLVSI
jgi:hypothetical protein